MAQDHAELVRMATQAFAFLGEEYGCEVEVTEPHPLLTKVAYKLDAVAVELSFDWHDLEVSCFLTKLSGGRLPNGFLVDGDRRVRYRLGDLNPDVYNRFGQLPRAKWLRNPPIEQWAIWASERMPEYVRIYAEILRDDFTSLRAKAEAGFASAARP